jgi:hypothetical protein
MPASARYERTGSRTLIARTRLRLSRVRFPFGACGSAWFWRTSLTPVGPWNCEKPSILEDDTLQFFVRDSVDDLGYYVDPVMRLHHVGEHVSPRSGRFAGLEGELTALDADGRIEMLFRMMGREVRTREYQVADLA